MYYTPSLCPYYGIDTATERMKVTARSCKDLVKEIFVSLNQKHHERKASELAGKLHDFWTALEFDDAVNQFFKDRGIETLESVKRGAKSGFDADFAVLSCAGYFNQNFRDATNLEGQ